MPEPRTGLTTLIEGGRTAVMGHGARGQVMGREAVNLLDGIPLFEGLSRRHLGKVAGVTTAKRYSPGSALVRVGQPPTAFYVVLDGELRVEVPGHPVALGPGDFFGEMALIDGEPRSATVVAVSEAYVMSVGRAKFLKLLEAEPKIALAIMATLTRRLRAAQASPAN